MKTTMKIYKNRKERTTEIKIKLQGTKEELLNATNGNDLYNIFENAISKLYKRGGEINGRDVEHAIEIFLEIIEDFNLPKNKWHNITVYTKNYVPMSYRYRPPMSQEAIITANKKGDILITITDTGFCGRKPSGGFDITALFNEKYFGEFAKILSKKYSY